MKRFFLLVTIMLAAACTHPSAPLVGITAVQFHPEKMLADGADWLPFFRAWVENL